MFDSNNQSPCNSRVVSINNLGQFHGGILMRSTLGGAARMEQDTQRGEWN